MIFVVVVSSVLGCGDQVETDASRPPAASPPAIERPDHPVWCPDAYDVVRQRERARGNGERGVAPRSPSDEAPPADRFDARRILGLTVGGARRVAAKAGCIVRVIKRDDEDIARTDDLRRNRLNVITERGVIVELEGVA